jgi:hypothetical protein
MTTTRGASTSRPVRAVCAVLLLAAAMTSCGHSGKARVAVLGDSITAFSNTTLHATLDRGYVADIIGKFGARADQMIDEATLLAHEHPEQAIINLGTNDAIQSTPPVITGQSLERIVTLLQGARCIALVTIDERMVAAGVARSVQAAAVNAQIRRIARDVSDVSVIDWTELVTRHGGLTAMTTDGVHPTPMGMQVLANAYRDALNDC